MIIKKKSVKANKYTLRVNAHAKLYNKTLMMCISFPFGKSFITDFKTYINVMCVNHISSTSSKWPAIFHMVYFFLSLFSIIIHHLSEERTAWGQTVRKVRFILGPRSWYSFAT